MIVFQPKRSLFAALVATVLSATLGHSQEVTVQVEGDKQIILTKRDIESFPHVSVAVHESENSTKYEGVAVGSLLEKAGVRLGESLRGKRMVSCLLVEAKDGYRVLIALPEIDPAFTEKKIVLAFLKNGAPLDQKEGPYRIVIPDEKRMARWVRQVTRLKIVNIQ